MKRRESYCIASPYCYVLVDEWKHWWGWKAFVWVIQPNEPIRHRRSLYRKGRAFRQERMRRRVMKWL